MRARIWAEWGRNVFHSDSRTWCRVGHCHDTDARGGQRGGRRSSRHLACADCARVGRGAGRGRGFPDRHGARRSRLGPVHFRNPRRRRSPRRATVVSMRPWPRMRICKRQNRVAGFRSCTSFCIRRSMSRTAMRALLPHPSTLVAVGRTHSWSSARCLTSNRRPTSHRLPIVARRPRFATEVPSPSPRNARFGDWTLKC